MSNDRKKKKSPKKSRKRLSKKEINKQLIIEYIADLDNLSLKTKDIAKHIGLGERHTQRYLIPKLWEEALKIRRERYAKLSIVVDMGLVKKAVKGDVAAARLYYEKFEEFEKRIKLKTDRGVTLLDGIKQVREHMKSYPEEKKRLLKEVEDE